MSLESQQLTQMKEEAGADSGFLQRRVECEAALEGVQRTVRPRFIILRKEPHSLQYVAVITAFDFFFFFFFIGFLLQVTFI